MPKMAISLELLPDFFDKPGVLYEHCSEFIFTETMRERKQLLEERSDATIVTPGWYWNLLGIFLRFLP